MTSQITNPSVAPWRRRLHTIIFESDTRAGRTFDVALLICILGSIAVVLMESVARFRNAYGDLLSWLEWGFTILFTIEYILRLASVERPSRYVFSFFGIADLLSIVPTYISLLVPGGQYFLVIRILRLLRIFRILKMGEYLREANVLSRAIWASRRKIGVFLFVVMTLVVIIGALMYVVEGDESGFVSIPTSIYWAIVTLTTVGYGDISPQTPLGRALASMVMIMGYGIIAVPTGIVSVEIAQAVRDTKVSAQSCPVCSAEGHDADAVHCKYCGGAL